MAKQLISSSSTKSVYRDGNVAIKEFCEGFPKAEVLNEALCNARVEDLPPRRAPGENLNVNGRECLVDDWQVDMGIATVTLRENIVG